MAKYLAEQLLNFNKEAEDQYRENWGTILKFIHTEGENQTENINQVDVFQRQMLAKEEALIAEQALKEAQLAASGNAVQAAQYHHNQKEKLQALVEEVAKTNDALSVLDYTTRKSQTATNKMVMRGGPSTGIVYPQGLSNQYSNQSIDLDRSSIEVSTQQHVSFQDIRAEPHSATPFSSGVGSTKKLNLKGLPKEADSPTPKTPQNVGSEVLDKLNVNIDQIDVVRQEQLQTTSPTGHKPDRLGKNVSMIDEYRDHGIVFGQTRMSHQSSGQRISFNEKQQQHSQDVRRRRTVQISKQNSRTQDEQIYEASDNQQQLWNTQKNLSFFAQLRLRNQQRSAFQQKRGSEDSGPTQFLSDGTIKTQQVADMGMAASSMTATPHETFINLNNLQTVPLRDQLLQRLQQFNSQAPKPSMIPSSYDLESNRMNSTQDSLFGMDFQGRQTHFGSMSRQRRATKSQFVKKHQKELARSSYMQSMMQIAEDLVEKRGKTMSYLQRPKNHRSSLSSSSKMQATTFKDETKMGQTTNSKLLQSANTASFGGFQHQGGILKQGTTGGGSNKKMLEQSSKMQLRQQQYFNRRNSRAVSEIGEQVFDHNMTPIRQGRRRSSCFQMAKTAPPKPEEENNYIYRNQRRVVINYQEAQKKLPMQQAMRQTFSQQPTRQTSIRTPQTTQHTLGDNNKFSLDLQTQSTAEEGSLGPSKQMPIKRFSSQQLIKDELVHVPNTSNAFFASGFHMIDGNADLETYYVTGAKREPQFADEAGNALQRSADANGVIDRPNQILKRLKMQTPGTNVNARKLRRIQQEAKNKVSYPYKDRFCGIYEEKKRTGTLKKDDSWAKFVNPDKMGLNNYMQHALHTEAGEQLKNSAQQDEEQQQDHITASQSNLASYRDETMGTERAAKGPKTNFRNNLERFHYQFDMERHENINDQATLDRIQKANKKFDDVIQRAKPTIKLYNLLGYSQTQYILFRQIQHWMRGHKYSDKKQTDNINNIQFAREFFGIIDDNDSGQASVYELAVPFIALGLSQDSQFIMKVMKAISPHKFGKKAKVANPFDTNELTLKEFIKIFKKDQVSENLTEVLCNRIIDRRRDEMTRKRREMERKQRALSVVKGGQTQFTVIEADLASRDETLPYHRVDADQMHLMEMVSQDSADLEHIQRTETGGTRRGDGYESLRANTVISSPMRNSTMKETAIDKALLELSSISINEMLLEVRGLWFELDEDKGSLEQELLAVSQMLCRLQVLPDVSSAQKYISNTIQSQTKHLDYDDFNSIFCKGIFRHSIVSKAHEIEKETALNPNANPEEKLEFQLKRKKNELLMGEMRLGRSDNKDEPTQVVKRPILQELWSIFYKNVPPSERENYEDFFKRMQGLTDTVIRDPTTVDLDAFAKVNKAKGPSPGKSHMNNVCDDHAELAKSPYHATDDDIPFKQKTAAQQRHILAIKNQSNLPTALQPTETKKKLRRGVSNISSRQGFSNKKPQDSARKSTKKQQQRTHNSQQSPRKTIETNKSQMSTNSRKVSHREEPYGQQTQQQQTMGNMSSHRTVASSNRQTAFGKSVMSAGVKFEEDFEEDPQYQNLDLKLCEDPHELMLQRKQRFDNLKKIQSLMERTSQNKTPGTDFLEEIYKRKEEEKRIRFQQAEMNQD